MATDINLSVWSTSLMRRRSAGNSVISEARRLQRSFGHCPFGNPVLAAMNDYCRDFEEAGLSDRGPGAGCGRSVEIVERADLNWPRHNACTLCMR